MAQANEENNEMENWVSLNDIDEKKQSNSELIWDETKDVDAILKIVTLVDKAKYTCVLSYIPLYADCEDDEVGDVYFLQQKIYVTLTPKNIANYIEKIKISLNPSTAECNKEVIKQLKNLNEHGSDIWNAYLEYVMKDIEIHQVVRKKKTIGGMFPYYISSTLKYYLQTIIPGLNLENSLGIYDTAPIDDVQHCLISALKFHKIDVTPILRLFSKEAFSLNMVDKNILNDISQFLRINIRLHYHFNDGKNRTKVYNYTYDIDDKNFVELGLIHNHFIPYFDIPICVSQLNLFDLYEKVENIHLYKKFTPTKKLQVKEDDYKLISSLTFITKLLAKYPKEFRVNTHNIKLEEDYCFENIQASEMVMDFSSLREKKTCIPPNSCVLYGDIEAICEDGLFYPYYIGLMNTTGTIVYLDKAATKDESSILLKSFNNFIRSYKQDENVVIYFHNAKYDMSMLYKALKIFRPLIRQNQFYTANVYKTKTSSIYFKDSYKMLPCPLSDFPKKFGFSEDKLEIEHPKSFDELDLEKMYDYFIRDLEVLRLGINAYWTMIDKCYDIDLHCYLTISSVAFEYMRKEDCYDGVRYTTGNLQKYIAESNIGGRVQIKNNQPLRITKDLCYLDANALYSAAMYRIPGYPLDTFTSDIDELKKAIANTREKGDFYIATIIIKDVTINRTIGCLPIKQKDNILWVTEATPREEYIGKTITICKYTLEDCVKYQGLEYELKHGIVFNRGYNKRVKDVIYKIHLERLKAKQAKSTLEQAHKGIQVSTYGKNGIKPNKIDIRMSYGDAEDIMKNFNERTKRITRINGVNIMEEYSKNYRNHKNHAHCASIILGMSKRIMNEYIYFLLDNNIEVCYTDTDSIIFQCEDVTELSKLYPLGEFMHDTNLGALGDELGGLKANKGIFVNKKVYCLELPESTGKCNFKNYIFRARGINMKAIIHKAHTEFDDNVYDLYNNDTDVNFDMLTNYDHIKDIEKEGFKPKYIKNGLGGVGKYEKFERKLAVIKDDTN